MIKIENGKEYKGIKNEIHKEKEMNAERNTQRIRKERKLASNKIERSKD